jgi:hypothetical protein
MHSGDLTKEQCAAIRAKTSEMVHYLALLKDRMDYKGFPADDPVKVAVENALTAVQKLHSETLTRSIGILERLSQSRHRWTSYSRGSVNRSGMRLISDRARFTARLKPHRDDRQIALGRHRRSNGTARQL